VEVVALGCLATEALQELQQQALEPSPQVVLVEQEAEAEAEAELPKAFLVRLQVALVALAAY
jgi:hypothetical protein